MKTVNHQGWSELAVPGMSWYRNEIVSPEGSVKVTLYTLRLYESKWQGWEIANYVDTFLSVYLLSNGTVDFKMGTKSSGFWSTSKTKTTISEANWYFSWLLMIDHISEDVKDL